MPEPYLQDADVTLYHGDVLAVLPELPDESVDCVVTSPPYWGLRDYGTGAWEGGDAECDHRTHAEPIHEGGRQGNAHGTPPGAYRTHRRVSLDVCGRCGAKRVDNQLGLEPTPEQYVERMVEVFREVRRVLAAHGTVWLNLGDSYSGGGGFAPDAPSNQGTPNVRGNRNASHRFTSEKRQPAHGLKSKDLVGIPWRVAFALQADGWYLRSDIIWAKPNPMPESVTDRPTKAHEYVFLLSKQPRYFFDQEAVREPATYFGPNGSPSTMDGAANARRGEMKSRAGGGRHARHYDAEQFKTTDERNTRYQGPNPVDGRRNIRSVWEIATQPYPEAHFATFPEELARRCIAAGCPEQVCRVCGNARERAYDKTPVPHWKGGNKGRGVGDADGMTDMSHMARFNYAVTAGELSDCGHADYRPGIALDPFMGSGTVAVVARKLHRHSIGIDLNEPYLQLASKRLQQQSLFAEMA